MGKFKVTFMVDELHTCEQDMREFLQTTEGISDVSIQYVQDIVEPNSKVAIDSSVK